ncbi:MAG: hypothetical protein ND866_07230 [Pyrinomonadaceae bacterium]|nr:hypothetical protein [Pyrinomonadaceae bacterium]
MSTLTVNLLFSTLILWVAARLYLIPRLHASKPQTVVVPILLLHSFRHLGLMFLAPGATYAGIPPQFAYPAAFGDLLAAVLALAAVFVVTRNFQAAKALVWIFNVEGTLDLLVAIALATASDASPYMGPAYWIPAFWVPALLVTHYITFLLLRKRWTGDHASSGGRIRSHLTNSSLKQVSTAIISAPFSNNSSAPQ